MLGSLWRLLFLLRIITRYRLDLLLLRQPLPKSVRLLLWCMFWRHFIQPKNSEAIRLKDALVDLGPIFVKLGQLLATRRDILSEEWAIALSTLLDHVPPFSGQESVAIIESALGQSVQQTFKSFEAIPMASASVAQVHSAELLTGETVVVKVIRPNIEHLIKLDIQLMLHASKLLAWWLPDINRLRLPEVIEQFNFTLQDELDLKQEAANASHMRRNFENSDILYIPKIYWQYTHTNILVQERIFALPVTDIQALDKCGINRAELARRGVEIFLTQVFEHRFFHADMHAGNIFVNPNHPHNPQYMAVDFGIVGSLKKSDQACLARILVAFFERDYQAIAELHLEYGWLNSEVSITEFESAIRAVSEPIFARPLAEISFADILLGLFKASRRFNMSIQPQLVLLHKTMINIEGLGRQLYPQLDLWATAQPILLAWYKKQNNPTHLLKQIREQWPDIAQQLPQLPKLIYAALENQANMPVVQMPPKRQPKNSYWRPVLVMASLVALGFILGKFLL